MPKKKFYIYISNENYGNPFNLKTTGPQNREVLEKCFANVLNVKDGVDGAVFRLDKKDYSKQDFEELFAWLRKETDCTEPCLVWLYYSGHGLLNACSGLTVVSCPRAPSGEEYYPLENELRELAGRRNVHVVSLFDCCRDEYDALPQEKRFKCTDRFTMT